MLVYLANVPSFLNLVTRVNPKIIKVIVWVLFITVLPDSAYAMHIAEGFLPATQCAFWSILVIPFLLWGFSSIKKVISCNPQLRTLLAMAGAFTFILSALKIPSLTGSCSHPTGVGLGAILFGPAVMSVLSFLVLIFQALLLAHGGITTLGANTFSMGVIGPLISFLIYKGLTSVKIVKSSFTVFLATVVGNVMTYITTSWQLAIAFHSNNGIMAAFIKFASVLVITQIPIAISEGILSVLVFNLLTTYGFCNPNYPHNKLASKGASL